MKTTCTRREDGIDGEHGRIGVTLPGAPVKLDKVCRSYRKGNRRHAASAVEFAVVAPIFLLLVFGMIEYGRMVMVQQVITNASREGARTAVIDGATNDEVVDAVQNYLNAAAINGANVSVSPDNPGDAAYGEPVTVTVSIDFSQVSWLPAPMYLGGQTMTAVSVMRREAVQ